VAVSILVFTRYWLVTDRRTDRWTAPTPVS